MRKMLAALRGEQNEAPDLDRALEQWRLERPADELLSYAARKDILDQAGEKGAGSSWIEPWLPLFFPMRRLALATALPMLVLCLMAGYMLLPEALVRQSADGSALLVQAIRQGDEVIFVIANGDKSHLVHKSNRPNGLGTGETFVVSDGSFSDRLDSGPDIVYYRID